MGTVMEKARLEIARLARQLKSQRDRERRQAWKDAFSKRGDTVAKQENELRTKNARISDLETRILDLETRNSDLETAVALTAMKDKQSVRNADEIERIQKLETDLKQKEAEVAALKGRIRDADARKTKFKFSDAFLRMDFATKVSARKIQPKKKGSTISTSVPAPPKKTQATVISEPVCPVDRTVPPNQVTSTGQRISQGFPNVTSFLAEKFSANTVNNPPVAFHVASCAELAPDVLEWDSMSPGERQSQLMTHALKLVQGLQSVERERLKRTLECRNFHKTPDDMDAYFKEFEEKMKNARQIYEQDIRMLEKDKSQLKKDVSSYEMIVSRQNTKIDELEKGLKDLKQENEHREIEMQTIFSYMLDCYIEAAVDVYYAHHGEGDASIFNEVDIEAVQNAAVDKYKKNLSSFAIPISHHDEVVKNDLADELHIEAAQETSSNRNKRRCLEKNEVTITAETRVDK